MAVLTVTAGAKEGAFISDEPGTFPATLIAVEDRGKGGLRSEGAPPFPGDATRPDYFLREWTFSIEGAEEDASLVWATSSLALSPTSKGFGYLVALCGGRVPPVGTDFDVETQLVGRMALVTVHRKPDGYMAVDAVTPMPTAPAAAGRAPKAAAPVAVDASLPF